MKIATSLSLDNKNFDFMNLISKQTKKTKSDFVDNLINSYRKFYLKKEIQEGFRSQTKDDVDLVMSDFGDYLEIIENKR